MELIKPIRYPPNVSKCFLTPNVLYKRCLYRRASRPVPFQISMRLQKEKQIDTTNQNSNETCAKTLSKPLSHVLPIKTCLLMHSSKAKIVACDLLLARLGKSLTKKEKSGKNKKLFCSFRKQLFSKSSKSLASKRNNLKNFVYEALENCIYSEFVSRLLKQRKI